MRPILFSWILIVLSLLAFCTNSHPSVEPSGLSGAQLAKKYCGSCHQYTPPDLLPKTIWTEDVLPAMGQRLGVYDDGSRPDSLLEQTGNRTAVEKAAIYPEQPMLASEDWEKIVDYYTDLAPDDMPKSKDTTLINSDLAHFTYREAAHARRPALTTLVKILPKERGLVYADTKPGVNKLFVLDSSLNLKTELNFRTAPIQYDTRSDTLYLTTIGTNPFPSDRIDGDLQIVYQGKESTTYDQSKIILPDLKRPVQVVYGDIDQDGLEDMVVCEFGNHTGQLAWYRNTGEGYTRQILVKGPGAIHAVITDWDRDGRQDILALMSQGREGIYLIRNQGSKGTPGDQQLNFTQEQLLSFSPLHGSQYFELHDFNGDGHLDVLYVCGDNADKTPILKNYHGLYIYENDGSGNLNQSWFFRQNGAYKAMAGDFDLDGDLDIASISFFPDYVARPEESFVYLENTGNQEFTPRSFPEATRGRWMVMDVADIDADGDLDIALGSFVYFTPMGDTTGLGQRWMEAGPSVILLENNIQ